MLKQRMLTIEGKSCSYTAQIKPRLLEVKLKLKSVRGLCFAEGTVCRNNYLRYALHSNGETKNGTIRLIEISRSKDPEVYITIVAMWLLKKGKV